MTWMSQKQLLQTPCQLFWNKLSITSFPAFYSKVLETKPPILLSHNGDHLSLNVSFSLKQPQVRRQFVVVAFKYLLGFLPDFRPFSSHIKDKEMFRFIISLDLGKCHPLGYFICFLAKTPKILFSICSVWAVSTSSGQPMWPHAHSPYNLLPLPLQSLPEIRSPGTRASPTSSQQLFF